VRASIATVNHHYKTFKGAINAGGRVLAKNSQDSKKSGLGSFIFVGCLIIGVGVGIGFNLMPAAVIIGFGVGLIAMGIARYKTGKW
jgi:hypothetical protein